jgi:hypothetical protein
VAWRDLARAGVDEEKAKKAWKMPSEPLRSLERARNNGSQ